MAVTEPTIDLPVWSLADRLRKAREHADLSRDELAERLGVKKNSLWNWESGASQPRDLLAIVNKWAQATGVPAAWLLGFSDSGYKQILHPVDADLDGPYQPPLHFADRPNLTTV